MALQLRIGKDRSRVRVLNRNHMKNQSISERALACIESRLKRIREAGGFHTDVGANVRRSVPVADDSLAVVVSAVAAATAGF
jgi:hypothetical protein